MGLDMYLNRIKKEEVAYWRKANAIHAWFERNVADGDLENCRGYRVSREDLLKLRGDCQTVLEASELVYKDVPVEEYDYDKREYVNTTRRMKVIKDESVAEKLLPTQNGFFYGSTLYDEGYIEVLENTIQQIDDIIATTNFEEWDLEYFAWW